MEDGNSPEVVRLRAIGAWMREVGATELELGDLRIKLAPKPREASTRAPSDPDEQAALTDEEREAKKERDEETEHRRFWERLTRSSGAPIPAFKRRSA